MTTREELEQLRFLSKEIKVLEEQIVNTKYDVVSDSVKGSDVNFPYTYHSIQIKGIDLGHHDKKIKALNKRLIERKVELINTVCSINDYIENIKDSEIRQIIVLKYINNWTWDKIATHLGYADESVPRKRMDRWLK